MRKLWTLLITKNLEYCINFADKAVALRGLVFIFTGVLLWKNAFKQSYGEALCKEEKVHVADFTDVLV